MSSFLTGAVSGLSGRVDSLESSYTFLIQQNLQNPDLEDFDSYKIAWNAQMQALTNRIASVEAQLSIVRSLAVNLSINVNDNLNTFKAHTGLPAVSGHRGLS